MSSGGRRSRVLLLNDEADIRLLWRLVIDGAGIDVDVVEAGSGTDALAVARSQRFDALVLDVMVPGPSGIDVAVELRRDGYESTPMLGTNAGRPAYLASSVRPFDAFVDMMASGPAIVFWLTETLGLPSPAADWWNTAWPASFRPSDLERDG